MMPKYENVYTIGRTSKVPFTLLTQELWEEIIAKLGLTGKIWRSLSKFNETMFWCEHFFTSYKGLPRGLRTRNHMWRGCFEAMQYSWEIARPKKLRKYREQRVCASCSGTRLNPLALHVQFQGKNIHDFQNVSIEHALQYFSKITLSKQQEHVGLPILKELIAKLILVTSRFGISEFVERRSLSGGEHNGFDWLLKLVGLQGMLIYWMTEYWSTSIDQSQILDSLENFGTA